MVDKERLITLVNGYGNAFEINLICSFELLSFASMYVIYTKNEKDANGNSIIYCGRIVSEDGKQYLVNIDDLLEWEQIKDRLKEMARCSYEMDSDVSMFEEKASKMKKLELPKNLFSNLDDFKIDSDVSTEKDTFLDVSSIVDFSYRNNREYRNKVKRLYDRMGDITPSDSRVDDVLYFNVYLERGIVIKSTISSLKKLWREYCSLYEEYHNGEVITKKVSDASVPPIVIGVEAFNASFTPDKEIEKREFNEVETNFDELFSSLSQRVSSINEYIDELKELQDDIDNSSTLLETEKNGIQLERDLLQKEKDEFELYKKNEQEKLAKKKQELQVRVNKFQVLVEQLDKKFKEVE